MTTKVLRALLVLGLVLPPVSRVAAQDFGIMESAEIIQPGNFKLTGYPMFVLGEGAAENDWGVVVRAGYGFTPRVDGELGLALYDGMTLFGGNVEVALVRAVGATGGFDFSGRGGVHLIRGDFNDGVGLDLAAILSSRLTQNLEIVGALDFNRSFNDDPVPSVNTVHLVPGIEYRFSRFLDLVAEVGIGLNDAAATYLSAGLAVYFR